MDIDVLERGCARAGVTERNIAEPDSVPWIGTGRLGSCRNLAGMTQELVEVREVEVVLVHAANRGEDRRECGLALLEDQEVHRHVTKRDRTGDCSRYNPSVRAVERERAHETESEAPRPAPYAERAVFAEEGAKD